MSGTIDLRNLLVQARGAIDEAIRHVDATRKRFRDRIREGAAPARAPRRGSPPQGKESPSDERSDERWRDIEWPMRKHRGETLADIVELDPAYLRWASQKIDFKSRGLREGVSAALQWHEQQKGRSSA